MGQLSIIVIVSTQILLQPAAVYRTPRRVFHIPRQKPTKWPDQKPLCKLYRHVFYSVQSSSTFIYLCAAVSREPHCLAISRHFFQRVTTTKTTFIGPSPDCIASKKRHSFLAICLVTHRRGWTWRLGSRMSNWCYPGLLYLIHSASDLVLCASFPKHPRRLSCGPRIGSSRKAKHYLSLVHARALRLDHALFFFFWTWMTVGMAVATCLLVQCNQKKDCYMHRDAFCACFCHSFVAARQDCNLTTGTRTSRFSLLDLKCTLDPTVCSL